MLILKSDLQIGGKYHALKLADYRTILFLHAYCDDDGVVRKATGEGYNLKDLSMMIGINSKTIKASLISLSDKKLIEIGKLKEIKVINFIKESDVDC